MQEHIVSRTTYDLYVRVPDTYTLTLPALPSGATFWQLNGAPVKQVEVKSRYRGFFTKVGKDAR